MTAPWGATAICVFMTELKRGREFLESNIDDKGSAYIWASYHHDRPCPAVPPPLDSEIPAIYVQRIPISRFKFPRDPQIFSRSLQKTIKKRKLNIDTENDGLWKMYLRLQIGCHFVIFWVGVVMMQNF